MAEITQISFFEVYMCPYIQCKTVQINRHINVLSQLNSNNSLFPKSHDNDTREYMYIYKWFNKQ